MTPLALISNGTYHVVLTEDGSGYSRWKNLAVTRWREDAARDEAGTFLYLRDAADATVWSAAPRPVDSAAAGDERMRFDAGRASFGRADRGIDVETVVAVAADADLELRRYRITNRSAQRRSLAATTFAELALAPPAADAAHPAFSKLFVETEFDPALQTIVATRRPSKPKDERCWYFHRVVVRGVEASLSFDTRRAGFIGRGRDVSNPAALDHGGALAGDAGPVLDASASIRAVFTLAPGESCTIDGFTGMAESREGCVALAARVGEENAGDLVIERCGDVRRQLLEKIGATEAEAKVWEGLAGAILQAGAALRAPAAEIAANRRGQSSLWAFGLSGDSPIVLLEAASDAALPLVDALAKAHAFWKAHGIAAETMVLAASAELAAAARKRFEASSSADRLGQRNGVFVQDGSAMASEDRLLLRSAARVLLDGVGGGLAALLERAEAGETPASSPAPVEKTRSSLHSSPTPDTTELVAFNGHGGFSPDLREYVVHLAADRMTPAPWVNVIANPGFGTVVSESGSATTWSENAHEFRLTAWSNDPVGDPNIEAIYLRDEETGRYWSPTLLPTRGEGGYVTRHGFGYSVFEHAEDGIESSLTVHVAIDAPVKFSRLTIVNRSDRLRRISATGYVEWVLGDERSKTLMHVATERDAETGAVFARNGYNTDFAGRTAFFDVDGDDVQAGGDRGHFFGRGGSLARPAAMSAARLSGKLGAALDPCAVLRAVVEIGAGESRELTFRLGAGKDPAEARSLVARFRGAEAARNALDASTAYWRRTLGAVTLRTPDPAVDALGNGWLLYQLLNARLWGRTGFYQSSGAYGFRDQLQDVMALAHAEPALYRAHLLRAAARQFAEGDVQHWWHPPTGKGIRTRCSDDYLWLPFATARYVVVTGDAAVLDEACPFLEAEPLKDDEESNYGQPKISEQTAPLYEHCVRALRHGLRYGEHGLPLMGHGDWNDGMDRVGAEGKGESVWLAFFLIATLKRFAPIARDRGDDAFAATCEEEAKKVAANIEASSWDGDWYLRAFFDDGSPLGSAKNAECQIDSIVQSWSVISGAAPRERAERAMEAVHDRLVRTDTRLLQLLDPPFDTSKPSPGYIAGYVPGVRENGGQYTHGATWTALAFAELGQTERAWESFSFLNPITHGDTAEAIAAYKAEPYVMAGDVYTSASHAGRGGWTWYTGSAGWMVQLLVESLLGLERRGDRLRLRPLLPRDWPGFELDYRFGGSTFSIACKRQTAGADGQSTGQQDSREAAVTLDGVPIPDGTILLTDDGRTHRITVEVPGDR